MGRWGSASIKPTESPLYAIRPAGPTWPVGFISIASRRSQFPVMTGSLHPLHRYCTPRIAKNARKLPFLSRCTRRSSPIRSGRTTAWASGQGIDRQQSLTALVAFRNDHFLIWTAAGHDDRAVRSREADHSDGVGFNDIDRGDTERAGNRTKVSQASFKLHRP
jgi:hypothetical protein